ncbi:hypothetical protein F7725_022020 [Dissostichus mawsoni]|uniref:Uncharacterized protein n=1 Tax=Dissostichus mawsoni TaxID=36200 RepID=A0A7J5ZEQ8_DISMA|nr:hypothetical protein F7725_022020 [Dissostichus mawsoni]
MYARKSLRRGSSFSFLTPRPQWDFSLKRKRREKDDSDAVSLCSFDFKLISLITALFEAKGTERFHSQLKLL